MADFDRIQKRSAALCRKASREIEYGHDVDMVASIDQLIKNPAISQEYTSALERALEILKPAIVERDKARRKK